MIKILKPFNLDIVKKSWIISRNNQDLIDEFECLKIDTSINDIPKIILEMETTILEREIITSTRRYEMWARTSRIDDICNFIVDEKFHSPHHDDLRQVMIDSKILGVSQDIYRMNLPLVSNTRYVLQLGLRTFIKLYKYFVYLRDISPMGEIFDGIIKEFYNILLISFDVDKTQILIDNYKMIKYNGIIESFEEKTNELNGFIIHSSFIPFSLRTHLARQLDISINDNLIDFITSKYLLDFTIGEKIFVQLGAPKSFWERVAEKRGCWIVQHDIWKPLLDKMNLKMDPPCNGDGKKCILNYDAELRYKDSKHGAPCPIHARDNKINLTKEQKSGIIKQIEAENKSNYWRKI